MRLRCHVEADLPHHHSAARIGLTNARRNASSGAVFSNIALGESCVLFWILSLLVWSYFCLDSA